MKEFNANVKLKKIEKYINKTKKKLHMLRIIIKSIIS